MKRHTGFLLSTISTAAVTGVLGLPDIAAARPTQSPAPIERLASIREAYLATLPEAQPAQGAAEDGDRIAQFPNFPNFPNFSNWRNQ